MYFVLFSLSKLLYVRNISAELCWIHLGAASGTRGSNPTERTHKGAQNLQQWASLSALTALLPTFCSANSRRACRAMCEGAHCMASFPAAILNGEVCIERSNWKDAFPKLQCNYRCSLNKQTNKQRNDDPGTQQWVKECKKQRVTVVWLNGKITARLVAPALL